MSQAVPPEDLDALLASLMAPAPEPAPVAEPAPAFGLALPDLPAEVVKVIERTRAWLDGCETGATWQAPAMDPPTPETELLDADVLLEMAAARAWQSGDQAALDAALARLPADRAEHHRGMAAVSDLIKARRDARAEASDKGKGQGGRS